MAHIERYTLRDGTRRYRVRWTGVDGKPDSKTCVFWKDAQRLKVEKERQASLGPLYEIPSEPFGDFFEGWMERYEQRVRKATIDRLRDVLPHMETFKPLGLDAIRSAEVEDTVYEISRTAPRQAELVLRYLKQVLSNARERGHRVDEAIFRVKPPRRDEREMRFLTWAEVDELATNTLEPFGNLIRFAALTGLRQGELFALRDRNIDFVEKRVSVENGVYKGELVPLKTKASLRKVDLCQRAAAILRQQLLARQPNQLGLVFPSARGQFLNDDNFRHRVFTPAANRTGHRGLWFHDLRHTYAALMVVANAHPKQLQVQMGHSSIKVTLDRYGHLYPDANRRVLEDLDDLTRSDDSILAPSEIEVI